MNEEKMAHMIIKGKLLRRAVMKENGLRMSVTSREKTNTKMNLARATTKSKSRTQTVTNGHVSQTGKE